MNIPVLNVGRLNRLTRKIINLIEEQEEKRLKPRLNLVISGSPANKLFGKKLLLMDAGWKGNLRKNKDDQIFGHDSPH